MFGKGILVMIAAFGISFAYYNSSRYRSIVEASGQAADYQYRTLAREAAKSGYALARQALTSGADDGIFEGNVADGAYRTVLSRSGSRYRIESQARLRDSRSMPVVWTIYGEYEKEPYTAPGDVPPFMDYALISGNSLQLSGSPDVDLSGFGDEENSNVHTNGSLHVSGNKVNIAGFGTYTGSATSNPASALDTSFQPEENAYDRPPVHQVEPIEIPPLDIATYLTKVTVDAVSGPVTLSGEYSLGGSSVDPYIWHVQGDLDASGDVEFDGNVLFLVDGEIRMSGNVTAGIDAEELGESTLAFYSSGDITFTGNVEIYGQFFTNSDFQVNGTPDLYGTIAARGSVTLGGTPQFNYVKASSGLSQIWTTDDPDLYQLRAYHEALDRTAEDKVDLFEF